MLPKSAEGGERVTLDTVPVPVIFSVLVKFWFGSEPSPR